MRSFQYYFNLVRKKLIVSSMIRWVSQSVLNAKLKSCERRCHLLSKNKEVGVHGVGKGNMADCTNQAIKDHDNLWNTK
jgi:hypothetical protein